MAGPLFEDFFSDPCYCSLPFPSRFSPILPTSRCNSPISFLRILRPQPRNPSPFVPKANNRSLCADRCKLPVAGCYISGARSQILDGGIDFEGRKKPNYHQPSAINSGPTSSSTQPARLLAGSLPRRRSNSFTLPISDRGWW